MSITANSTSIKITYIRDRGIVLQICALHHIHFQETNSTSLIGPRTCRFFVPDQQAHHIELSGNGFYHRQNIVLSLWSFSSPNSRPLTVRNKTQRGDSGFISL